MSPQGRRRKRPDHRELELEARVAAARSRLDSRANDLGASVDRIVNPIQSLRRLPITGIAAGLATGIASGWLLTKLRSRRARKEAGNASNEAAAPPPGAADLLAAAIPALMAWLSRGRKPEPGPPSANP